jgi:hypothetical protein
MGSRFSNLILVVICCAFPFGTSPAATRVVDPGGPDGCRSIRAAIAATAETDTIEVPTDLLFHATPSDFNGMGGRTVFAAEDHRLRPVLSNRASGPELSVYSDDALVYRCLADVEGQFDADRESSAHIAGVRTEQDPACEIDQSCDSGAGVITIGYASPCGQSFVPTVSSHTAVELRLDVANPTHDPTVTVELREGALDGPTWGAR